MSEERWFESNSSVNAKPVPASPGFAIPERFPITATVHDPAQGAIEVTIDVEVRGGHAVTRRVSIGTEREGGVSAKVIRAVPIRDIVEVETRRQLLSVELLQQADGKPNARLAPAQGDSQAIRDAVKTLVGYVDGTAKPATVRATATIPDVSVKTEKRGEAARRKKAKP
jgi:hypothetical protein